MLPGRSAAKPPAAKASPKTSAGPRAFHQTIDVNRVVTAVAVLAVGVVVAIYAISRTFTPGPVTRLESTSDDAGPPAPAESQPANEPKAPTAGSQAPAPPASARQTQGMPEVPAIVIARRPAPAPRASTQAQASASPAAPAPASPATTRGIAAAARDPRLAPPELRFEAFEQVQDSQVYTARDADVEPPVVVYPQQLGRVPLGARPEDVAYVEVTVTEAGSVAEVKATNSPRTLDDAMVLTMSLSAAKTWRFQPARKDGRAVKYRQVLPVSLR